MTDLTTLDRLKVCRATGSSVTFGPEGVNDLIALFEAHRKARDALRRLEASLADLRAAHERMRRIEDSITRGWIVTAALAALVGLIADFAS